MSRGVNKAILVGNLGADPEVRYTAGNNAVCNFNLATSESWKDKQTGEPQEKTEWHRVVLFNRLGEIAGEYLKKGSKVYIEGRIQTRKWQGQDGQDRYTTEIVANEMQMLDSRNDSRNDSRGGGSVPMDNGGYGGQASRSTTNPSGTGGGRRSAPASSGNDNSGDDIPYDDVPF